MFKHGARILVAIVALGTCSSAPAQSIVDPSLPPYRPGEKLSGKISIAGFNSMSQVASIWGEGFKQFHPGVTFEIRILSTGETIDAVTGGGATFGLLSRELENEEVAAFQEKVGYPPTVLVATKETIGVFVHKDNPVESLTIQQLDGMFSTTHRQGSEKTAQAWGELGLDGEWARQPIVCHGRDADVATQLYFQQAVLAGGEFRKDLKEHEDSLQLIKSVAAEKGAVGITATTYLFPGVKAVPIARIEGQEAVAVGSLAATQGAYPLARPLPMIVNSPPTRKLSELDSEFLKYVFSRLGQEDVVKAGYQPISARPAQIAREAIGLGVAR